MDTGRNFQLMRVFRHSLEVERYKKVIKISSLFPKLNKILRNISNTETHAVGSLEFMGLNFCGFHGYSFNKL